MILLALTKTEKLRNSPHNHNLHSLATTNYPTSPRRNYPTHSFHLNIQKSSSLLFHQQARKSSAHGNIQRLFRFQNCLRRESSAPENIQRFFCLQDCLSRKSPISRKYSKTFRATAVYSSNQRSSSNQYPSRNQQSSSKQQQQSTAATSDHIASSIPAATSNHPATSSSNQQQQPAAATSSSNQQQQSTAATSSSNQWQRPTAASSSNSQHSSYQQHLHDQRQPPLVIITVPSRRYPTSS